MVRRLTYLGARNACAWITFWPTSAWQPGYRSGRFTLDRLENSAAPIWAADTGCNEKVSSQCRPAGSAAFNARGHELDRIRSHAAERNFTVNLSVAIHVAGKTTYPPRVQLLSCQRLYNISEKPKPAGYLVHRFSFRQVNG